MTFMQPANLYDEIGGEAAFTRIVARFYEGVAGDPVLRPLYPEQDLAPAADRLAMFLMQYWGGPSTYSDERGHPRLRIRHRPFAIGIRERDAWLEHMRAALDGEQLPPEIDARLWQYLQLAADSLRNVAD